MKKHIAKLLKSAPDAESVYLEHSDWFEDETPAEIKKAIKVYEKHYEKRLEEAIGLLGDPSQTEKTHRKAIAKWFPEALRAACWDQDGKTLCLALEHQDRESPVGVVLRCLTADEIAELSE